MPRDIHGRSGVLGDLFAPQGQERPPSERLRLLVREALQALCGWIDQK